MLEYSGEFSSNVHGDKEQNLHILLITFSQYFTRTQATHCPCV